MVREGPCGQVTLGSEDTWKDVLSSGTGNAKARRRSMLGFKKQQDQRNENGRRESGIGQERLPEPGHELMASLAGHVENVDYYSE